MEQKVIKCTMNILNCLKRWKSLAVHILLYYSDGNMIRKKLKK